MQHRFVDHRPFSSVTDDELAGAASELWGHLAPRTWNRHVATVRSFTSWCRDHWWPAGDLHLGADRRAVPADDSKAIPLPQLERLWGNRDIPLRERALWRLLYNSAAHAEVQLAGYRVADVGVPQAGHDHRRDDLAYLRVWRPEIGGLPGDPAVECGGGLVVQVDRDTGQRFSAQIRARTRPGWHQGLSGHTDGPAANRRGTEREGREPGGSSLLPLALPRGEVDQQVEDDRHDRAHGHRGRGRDADPEGAQGHRGGGYAQVQRGLRLVVR